MKHRYLSDRRINTYWRNQNGYDFLIEAVHTPVEMNDWKWNIPYYCYLYQKDEDACFLVATREVTGTLKEGEEPSMKDVLEMYEESSLELLDKTSIQDAYFYETYLFLKSFLMI